MKLTHIEIFNFRSIKNETIAIDRNCLILLGKNEAGKSNVLKAIAALFGAYKVTAKDRRKRIDNENIALYCVRGVLRLSPQDRKSVLARFQKSYRDTKLIEFSQNRTLSDFIESAFDTIALQIDIDNNETSNVRYWKFRQENTKKDFTFADDVYLSAESFRRIQTGALLTFERLHSLLFTYVKELYAEQTYNCLYWRYSDSYLLPNSIDIDEFTQTPDNYASLKNIFALCNRGDIKSEFRKAKEEDGDYLNLCEQVSRTTTKIFQSIWKDFKNTSILLQPYGEEILIKVANKAKYSFEDRSDGFKKFISILLMLSTRSRVDILGDRDIILIDEPDQSLYPTSARYLRDELLRISRKCLVIYSTHSQYMIDSDCVERHLIVEKNDDITTFRKEEHNAAFSNDELLRNAIGTTIFECLQHKNIIFEGWLDKELFVKYCKFRKIESHFNNVGSVYLGGISGVEALVQILILAQKEFLIVADSDEASLKKKRSFSEGYPDFKTSWVGYADVVDGIATMEDFMTAEHIESTLGSNGYPGFVFDPAKSAMCNIERAVGRDNKEEKQRIKNKLVELLTKDAVKDEYSIYVDKMREILAAGK